MGALRTTITLRPGERKYEEAGVEIAKMKRALTPEEGRYVGVKLHAFTQAQGDTSGWAPVRRESEESWEDGAWSRGWVLGLGQIVAILNRLHIRECILYKIVSPVGTGLFFLPLPLYDAWCQSRYSVTAR